MSTRLYVGNLSYESTEDTLTRTFEQNARTVNSVTVVLDRATGRPRGFAFVEMEHEEEAQSAITDLNGTELDGRELKVSEAQSRPSAQRSSGGSRDRKRW